MIDFFQLVEGSGAVVTFHFLLFAPNSLKINSVHHWCSF